MKKIIALLFISTAAIVNLQAAGSDPVNKVVRTSFKKEFSTVKDVNWSWVKDQDVYKASFQLNSKPLHAYFSRDGEFIATSRYISTDQLPVMLLKEVNEHYKDFAVRTVIEYSTLTETNYFITVESKKIGYVLKGSSNGALSHFKKIKKNTEN